MITLIMKTYFFLSRKNTNKKGLAPIYCRIANGPDRADFSTGIYIAEKDWNVKNGMPQKNLIREYTSLQKLQSELIPFIFSCENSGVTTPLEVLKLYRNKLKPKSHFIIDVTNEFLQNIKVGKTEHRRLLEHIRKICQKWGNIEIRKIDISTLNRWKSWLVSCEYKTTTINKKMALLKRLLRYAEQKEYINKSPFYFYQPLKNENKKPISISSAELAAMESVQLCSRLDNVRNLFLLQCYTGLSYIDLANYDSSNIITVSGRDFYRGNRKKTDSEFYFPLSEKIKQLYENCQIISNQKYNSYLKELGEKIGTEKKLTTHVGRRTFAQLNINKGLSFEAVAVMLGHSSTRMTEKHYSRAGIERLTEELRKFG